jgi:hypothetical protein
MRTAPVAVVPDAADDMPTGASNGIGRNPVSVGTDIVGRRRDGHHGAGYIIRNGRRCVDDRWRRQLTIPARPALDVLLLNIAVDRVCPAIDILGRRGFLRKDVGGRCRSDSNDDCGERAQRRSHSLLR